MSVPAAVTACGTRITPPLLRASRSPRESAKTGGRGWLATAQFGCDYQFDQQWVFGLFGDGNWGGFKGDYQDNAFLLWGREKEKWAWAGGGRVGFLIYPQLLTFASAGYT